jgi:hypothetical protein
MLAANDPKHFPFTISHFLFVIAGKFGRGVIRVVNGAFQLSS